MLGSWPFVALALALVTAEPPTVSWDTVNVTGDIPSTNNTNSIILGAVPYGKNMLVFSLALVYGDREYYPGGFCSSYLSMGASYPPSIFIRQESTFNVHSLNTETAQMDLVHTSAFNMIYNNSEANSTSEQWLGAVHGRPHKHIDNNTVLFYARIGCESFKFAPIYYKIASNTVTMGSASALQHGISMGGGAFVSLSANLTLLYSYNFYIADLGNRSQTTMSLLDLRTDELRPFPNYDDRYKGQGTYDSTMYYTPSLLGSFDTGFKEPYYFDNNAISLKRIGNVVYQYGSCLASFAIEGVSCGLLQNLQGFVLGTAEWDGIPTNGALPASSASKVDMTVLGDFLVLYDSQPMMYPNTSGGVVLERQIPWLQFVTLPTNAVDTIHPEGFHNAFNLTTATNSNTSSRVLVKNVNNKLVSLYLDDGLMSIATIGCPKGLAGTPCVACRDGFFANATGMAECMRCSDAGGICPQPGSDKLLQRCNAGSEPAVTTCSPCAPGHFSPNGFPCTACPNGTITRVGGKSSCESCPEGYKTVTPTAARQCRKCPTGYYNGDAGSAECYPCPFRTWSLRTGASSCTPVEGGHIAAIRGAPVAEGATEQISCRAGTYQDGNECFSCPAFQVSSEGAQNCSVCKPGFAPTATASSCISCFPGQFSEDGTRCTDCAAGFFSPTREAAQCTPCPPGRYTTIEGQSQCVECKPKQEYQDEFGQTSCKTCPIPGSQVLASGATLQTDCQCRGNAFPDNVTLSCVECPTGAVCRPGLQPVSASGFFKNGGTYIPCKYAPACQEGDVCRDGHDGFLCGVCKDGYYRKNNACIQCPENGTTAWIWIFPLTFAILVALGMCAASGVRTKMRMKSAYNDLRADMLTKIRLNQLSLEVGESEDESEDGPLKAKEANKRSAKATAMEILNIDLSNVHHASGQEGEQQQQGNSDMDKLLGIVGALENLPVLLMIFVNFGQTTALLGSFNFDWPEELNNFWGDLSFFNVNIDLAAPECNSTFEYEHKWVLTILLPVLILGYVWTVYCIIKLYSRMRKSKREALGINYPHPMVKDEMLTFPREALDKGFGGFVKDVFKFGVSPAGLEVLFDEAVRGSVVVLSTCYIFLSTKSVELYVCVRDEAQGKSFMSAAPEIECGSSRWNNMIAPSVLAALFYTIGIPAVFTMILFRIRNHLRSNETLYRYGVLFKNYDFDSYWWALLIFVRKALLVLTSIISPSGKSIVQAGLSMLFLFFFLLVHGMIRPFRSRGADVMELLTLSINFLTALCGVCFQVLDEEEVESRLAVFLISLIIIGFLSIAITLAMDIRYTSAYNKATLAPYGQGADLLPASAQHTLMKARYYLSNSNGSEVLEFIKKATDDEKETMADALSVIDWMERHTSLRWRVWENTVSYVNKDDPED